MRLIDADRLKYVISCALDVYKQTEDDASSADMMSAIAKLFFEFIDGAPSLHISQMTAFAKDYDAIDLAYQKGREDALNESACRVGEKCDGHNNHGNQF